MTTARTADVVVVGGGIIGAAIAERLARDGRRVVLVERGEIGREASWAAAGLLTPVHPWRYPEPLLRLDAESLAMWPDAAARLAVEADVDLELRRTGLLSLVETDEDETEADRRVAWKRGRGETASRLTRAEALALEPLLAPSIRGALLLPDLAQIRNHRAAPAFAAAAARRGATVLPRTSALGFVERAGRVVGVRTSGGDVSAGAVVLAAGAWSGQLGGTEPGTVPPSWRRTIPARGQMLLLAAAPGAVRHMILASGEYLVPRADGRVLAGSTLEYVGFDKSVTPEGTASISSAVARMTPTLAGARVEASWAGLRPDTPDHLPFLGEARPGLFVATGHFRSGIMLAPVTAEIVRDLIDGRTSRDLSPFAPTRRGPPIPSMPC
jgi:glycine oxidase